MKKLLVNTSDNIKLSSNMAFLSPEKGQEITLQKADQVRIHIKGQLTDAVGNQLYTVWTVSSRLFGSNVFLRGVEEVADGWQVVLDCSALSSPMVLTKDTAILVGRVTEPVLLHRIGSDVAANGARILG